MSIAMVSVAPITMVVVILIKKEAMNIETQCTTLGTLVTGSPEVLMLVFGSLRFLVKTESLYWIEWVNPGKSKPSHGKMSCLHGLMMTFVFFNLKEENH